MTRRHSVPLATIIVLALTLLQDCRGQDPEPAPTQPQKPLAVIDAVLTHHHGPLRGKLDKVLLELRPEPEAAPTQALLSLPDRLRVDRSDRDIELLIEGIGWSCDGRKPAVRLQGDALARLRQLRHHLRALVLAPLYEAKKVERQSHGVLSLVLPGGETWRLELDEATLELENLRGPAGVVRFKSFLNTGVTVLPAVVVLPEDRVRHLKFRANPSLLHPRLFSDPSLPLPGEPIKRGPIRQRTVDNPNERPPVAELQEIERRMYLAHRDPGTWNERTTVIIRSGNALGRKGQAADGLPSYRFAADGPQLLIPFKPDESRGHEPYLRGPKDVILHVPGHSAVVVAPAPGTWDDVIERGRKEILAFLRSKKLEADGPMIAIPFVDAGEIPSARDLRRLRIRLEQRARPRD